MTEAAYHYLRLSLIDRIGPHIGRQIIHACGSLQNLWRMQHKDWLAIDGVGEKLASMLSAADMHQADKIFQRCEDLNMQIVCPEDAAWPCLLTPLDDAPLVLFVKGDIETLSHTPMLAVVGARRSGKEGRLLTRRWCRYLSERGVAIVSGMAYGIDAAAHGGTLEGASPTIAVLGCGLNMCAGTQEKQLDAVAAQGCAISEYPPDTEARPEHFPSRNRIIAGIAEATLVMEAGLKSGSLITANQALRYGREVFAVPGSVLTERHAGCHHLIRDGAVLTESVEDILTHQHWGGTHASACRTYTPDSKEEARVLHQLQDGIIHIDVLAEHCRLTVPQLSPILLALEFSSVIESLPAGRYAMASGVKIIKEVSDK